MKAQASIEFLALVGMGIALFATSLLVYASYLEESKEVRSTLEAHSICLHTAADIGAVAAMGGYIRHTFNLPEFINGENYTVWVISDPSANRSLVKVDYKLEGGLAGIGCRFPSVKIVNSSGSSSFALPRHATIETLEIGGITVTQ